MLFSSKHLLLLMSTTMAVSASNTSPEPNHRGLRVGTTPAAMDPMEAFVPFDDGTSDLSHRQLKKTSKKESLKSIKSKNSKKSIKSNRSEIESILPPSASPSLLLRDPTLTPTNENLSKHEGGAEVEPEPAFSASKSKSSKSANEKASADHKASKKGNAGSGFSENVKSKSSKKGESNPSLEAASSVSKSKSYKSVKKGSSESSKDSESYLRSTSKGSSSKGSKKSGSSIPTQIPSNSPSPRPSDAPSNSPSWSTSTLPSELPSSLSSKSLSRGPSAFPSQSPSIAPSSSVALPASDSLPAEPQWDDADVDVDVPLVVSHRFLIGGMAVVLTFVTSGLVYQYKQHRDAQATA